MSHNLSDTINRKFIESFDVDEWEISTDSGWQPISKIHKTIEYEEWEIVLESGLKLVCADTHIVFYNNFVEVFAKDLQTGQYIITEYGLDKVVSVKNLQKSSHMYDIELPDGTDHRYYTSHILSHNTTGVAAYFMWFVTFHGNSTVGMCAHKAKNGADTIRRIKLMYMNLPRFMKKNVTVWNRMSISFEGDTNIIAQATTEDAFRGFSLSIIYLDEFAFVKPSIQNEFMTSVLPSISAGKNTKMVITSTPNGLGNKFYSICKGAMEGKSLFKYMKYIWSDKPGRDESFRTNMIYPLGPMSPEQFEAEHCAEFLGSSNTLINASTLKSLSYENPKFNKVESMEVYEMPRENGIYFITVDVAQGLGLDYSTFTVFDITKKDTFKQVAVFRDNKIKPLALPNILMAAAEWYNKAYVLIELNDLGTQVGDVINDEYEYENLLKTEPVKSRGGSGMGRFRLSYAGRPGVKTTVSTKRVGCSNLKQLMESGKLEIVDKETIEEFTTFIDKKGNGQFAAELGCHDDLVMNSVLFAWAVNEKYFANLHDINFRSVLQEDLTKADNYKFYGGVKTDGGVVDNGYVQIKGSNLLWEVVGNGDNFN